MYFRFLLFLLMACPLLLTGQLSSSVDIVFGFDYTHRRLWTNSENELLVGIVDRRNTDEVGELNMQIGFNFNQQLSKKLYFKAGFRCTSMGYRSNQMKDLFLPSDHDGMGGGTSTAAIQYQSIDYWFVELPIALRYQFSHKKYIPFVELGTAPSFFTTIRTTTKTTEESSTSFNDGRGNNFNRLHMVGQFSVGLVYIVDDRFQLVGQPTLRYHFTDLVNAPISEKLFAVGIEFGARRRF